MTDNEIIKALECCKTWDSADCKECPNRNSGNGCINELMQKTLDLINRLKAENEALISAQETLEKHIEKAKTEARKEFAERLKVNITINNTEDGYLLYSVDYNCLMDDIDDLVKEMEGDTE